MKYEPEIKSDTSLSTNVRTQTLCSFDYSNSSTAVISLWSVMRTNSSMNGEAPKQEIYLISQKSFREPVPFISDKIIALHKRWSNSSRKSSPSIMASLLTWFQTGKLVFPRSLLNLGTS